MAGFVWIQLVVTVLIIGPRETLGQARDLNSLRKVLSPAAKQRCKTLYKSHGVVPGQSWGTMNEDQQQEWLRLECDLRFCKRDSRMGRGIYKCQNQNE